MDPDSASTTLSTSTATPINVSRRSCTLPPSPEISGFTGLVTLYSLSPKPAKETSCTAAAMEPPPSDCHDHSEFATVLASIQTQGESDQRSYVSSQSQDDSAWSAAQTQSSSEDLEHYTFQSSPAASGFPHRNMSEQSSPRSGNSPGYYNPAPWQSPMPEGHAGQKARRGLQLTSYPSREGIDYYHYSSAPFPPISAHYHSQSFDSSDGTSYPIRSHPEQYRDQYHSPPRDGVIAMADNCQSASPCSSTFVFRPDEDSVLSPCPTSEPGEDFTGSQYLCRIGSNDKDHRDGSPPCSPTGVDCSGSASPTALANAKNEEPYAQLIYRAFMSTKPRYSMTLQDIYQWFRENTDKGKSDSKGWQNSIRHNLSMNQAFTKTERKWSTNGEANEDHEDDIKPTETTLSSASTANSNASAGDSKKSTKWYLEPWAVSGGVQSTTRYRKGNLSRRGGSSSNSNSKIPPGMVTASGMKRNAAYSSRVIASSRKGPGSGINKFKTRQDARLLRGSSSNPGIQLHHYYHHPHHLQQQQQHQHQRELPHLMHPHGGPLPLFHVPVPGVDYEYGPTDPQLTGYPSGMTSEQQHPLHQYRAPSEPTIDEPVTPEPTSFGTAKGDPAADSPHCLLPLHRATGSSSSGSGIGPPLPEGPFHYSSQGEHAIPISGAGGGAYSIHHHHHGGSVVGVYDEVTDRYGDWRDAAAAAASIVGSGGWSC